MSRRPLARAVLVLVGFAVVGALLGVLWAEVVWSPGDGQVRRGVWYPLDEASLAMQTGGTSTYVAVAAIGGLVLGLLAALTSRRAELAVLAGVILGSALGAYLMWLVGTTLGPSDPASLAKGAANGTRLPGALTVDGSTPFLTMPTAALVALACVYFLSPEAGRGDRAPDGPGDEHPGKRVEAGLPGPPPG